MYMRPHMPCAVTNYIVFLLIGTNWDLTMSAIEELCINCVNQPFKTSKFTKIIYNFSISRSLKFPCPRQLFSCHNLPEQASG